MALSNEKLEQKLDALDEAIFSGVLEIEYEGRKQRFRSHADMLKARNMILKQLGRTGKLKRITVAANKNL